MECGRLSPFCTPPTPHHPLPPPTLGDSAPCVHVTCPHVLQEQARTRSLNREAASVPAGRGGRGKRGVMMQMCAHIVSRCVETNPTSGGQARFHAAAGMVTFSPAPDLTRAWLRAAHTGSLQERLRALPRLPGSPLSFRPPHASRKMQFWLQQRKPWRSGDEGLGGGERRR